MSDIAWIIGSLTGMFVILLPLLLISAFLWFLHYVTDKEKFKRHSRMVFELWIVLYLLWIFLSWAVYPMIKKLNPSVGSIITLVVLLTILYGVHLLHVKLHRH